MKLAFPKIDHDLVDPMEAINESGAEAHQADDSGGFARLNHDFHFALFDRAELPLLSRHIDMLWKSVAIYQMPVFADHAIREAVLSEHERLIDACRHRDFEVVLQGVGTQRGKAVKILPNLVVDDGHPLPGDADAQPDEASDRSR